MPDITEYSIMQFFRRLRTFPLKFWLLNLLNMSERLAWWVLLLQMPIYIAQKGEADGLQWEQATKGVIYFWWAIVQNLTPIFSGGFADRYGKRKVLIFAIIVAASGYFLVGVSDDFVMFLFSVIFLGFGLGVYKPALQGAIAGLLTKENSSLGWSVNNMLINSAVFIGVPMTIWLKGISWQAVFTGSAIIMILSITFLFFTGPLKNVSFRAENPLSVLKRTFRGIVRPRIMAFVIIMSGFTMIYMQFYETIPNFIVDWADTSALVSTLGLPDFMIRETGRGVMIAYEWLYNINTGMIVLMVVFVTGIFSRFSRTLALFWGLLIVTAGFCIAGVSMAGWILVAGFAVYTIGEMISNPAFHDYMSRTAPPDEKALFMGYLSVSWTIGLAGGALAGGWLYGRLGEKAAIAMSYLKENYPATDGINLQNAYTKLVQISGLSEAQVTEMLWDYGDPWIFALPFVIVGIFASLGMLLYRKKTAG